jgi:DNA-binding NarL/FixJ family response regulator
MNGVEATMAIRAEFPDARIIVLTHLPGRRAGARALNAGASGYLLKNSLRHGADGDDPRGACRTKSALAGHYERRWRSTRLKRALSPSENPCPHD